MCDPCVLCMRNKILYRKNLSIIKFVAFVKENIRCPVLHISQTSDTLRLKICFCDGSILLTMKGDIFRIYFKLIKHLNDGILCINI